ncbi:hypothetical protein BWQ93_10645 [Sphingopyxis sp. QXT-31]|uniref:hypothetical protein n=1 Tax=Sphingopyxis sp. QXT-31 TaxID=1357916 RepID=UPI00097941BE|nr:hypothetical protein [Sphingopyxis sp. QXT-31]APZ98903.1 hypothetical protein BWQ93_10645 [Sphingopyxis sp. QXT-31]
MTTTSIPQSTPTPPISIAFSVRTSSAWSTRERERERERERDAELRSAAIDELYDAAPVMYEPDAVLEGRAAISAVAGKLLEQFGPEFRFWPISDRQLSGPNRQKRTLPRTWTGQSLSKPNFARALSSASAASA